MGDESSDPSRITSQMPSTTVNVHVPGNHLMTGLLGQRDELLLLNEDAFPEADVHVRGNEITLTGGASAVAAARGLVDELLTMTRNGVTSVCTLTNCRACSPPGS